MVSNIYVPSLSSLHNSTIVLEKYCLESAFRDHNRIVYEIDLALSCIKVGLEKNLIAFRV